MLVHIVEDDVAVLDSLKIFLEGLGHEVQVYMCAECFLKKKIPTCKDTVIVDLCLTGIHGTQLIRWMKALKDCPRIIAISGQSEIDIKEQMKDLSEVVIIRKPLTELGLMEHLQ